MATHAEGHATLAVPWRHDAQSEKQPEQKSYPIRKLTWYVKGKLPDDEAPNAWVFNKGRHTMICAIYEIPVTKCGIVYHVNYISLYVLQIKHAPPPAVLPAAPSLLVCYDGVA